MRYSLHMVVFLFVALAVGLTGCPSTVQVPALAGMMRTQAETAIVAAGLVVGGVTAQFHDTVPAGTVISQAPAAGTSREPGTSVDFVLSKGPDHPSHGDSVKLVTFNVRMIPETWDDFCCEMSNETRAKVLGDLISAEDYDIVVLNEVFDEDSKDAFEDRLKGDFPYYVKQIDMPLLMSIEDSGLMLFSRFPFQPLPNPYWMLSFPLYAAPIIDAYANGQNASSNVAAIVYPQESCSDFDCQSSKGIGVVRVQNPETNHILNVAFSHTQASYGDGECKDEVDGRSMQFVLAQQLLTVALGNSLDSEAVFLLGDLNVNGDQLYCWRSGSNYGYLHGGPCESESLWEWTRLFNTPGAFLSDVLEDSWVYEMQGPNYYGEDIVDRGLTAGMPLPSERLDYVLWNRDSRYQVQHLTREHRLRAAASSVLSDHIPVCADYNVSTPFCSPATARVPVQDAFNTGNISQPGSMQWYRIDEPGTYLVAVTGDDMAFSVYESKDLTTPAPQYYEEVGEIQVQVKPPLFVTGRKFCFPEAPFYIRVYKTQRHLTGTYQLAVHRLTGANQEEAVSLLPSTEWFEYEWPDTPLNQDDCVWFKIHVETADNPVPQHVQFHLARYWDNFVSLGVYKEDGDTLCKDEEAEPYTPVPGTWSLFLERDDLGTKPEVLYVKAFRSQVWPITFLIGWDTNLTVLHGQYPIPEGIPGAVWEMLFCHEETDGGIDDLDETYITIVADGKMRVDDQWTKKFDDDYNYDLETVLGTIRFVNDVKITLREDDDGGYGDDDHFFFTIGPLPFWQRELLGQRVAATDEDAVGVYSISYNLSRTLQQLP